MSDETRKRAKMPDDIAKGIGEAIRLIQEMREAKDPLYFYLENGGASFGFTNGFVPDLRNLSR